MNFDGWTPRQVVRATLVVVGVLVAFYLLYYFSEILFLLVIAIILGMAVQPLVRHSARLGGNRSNNVLLVYSLLVMIIGLLLIIVAPLLIRQTVALLDELPANYERLRLILLQRQGQLAFLAIELPLIDQIPSVLTGFPADGDGVTEALVSITMVIAKGIIYFVAVFMLAAFWSLEKNRLLKGLENWLPPDQRRVTEELTRAFETKVGEFLRAQTILCLVVGLLSLIAYLIIGLPYPLALAALAGLMEAVPIFGPTLGAIPAVLVAVPMGIGPVLGVVVASMVIQALENSLLVPRIMDHSVGVHPILTLLSLVTLASLLGIAGGILAIPFASGLQVLFRQFRSTSPNDMGTPDGRGKISALRYQANELMEDIGTPSALAVNSPGNWPESVRSELETVVIGLDRYLEKLKSQEEEL